MADSILFSTKDFWLKSEAVAALPKLTRYFYGYLKTSPDIEKCGVFETSFRAISIHTEETREEIQEHFRCLEEHKLAYFRDGWIVLPELLKDHKWAAGSNQWKGVLNEFLSLPKDIQDMALSLGYSYDRLVQMTSNLEGYQGLPRATKGSGSMPSNADNIIEYKIREEEDKGKEYKASKEEPVNAYGSHVKLSEDQYTRLTDRWPKKVVDDYIERVNDYCSSKRPKGYQNYESTIRNWLKNASVPEVSRSPPGPNGTDLSGTIDPRLLGVSYDE